MTITTAPARHDTRSTVRRLLDMAIGVLVVSGCIVVTVMLATGHGFKVTALVLGWILSWGSAPLLLRWWPISIALMAIGWWCFRAFTAAMGVHVL